MSFSHHIYHKPHIIEKNIFSNSILQKYILVRYTMCTSLLFIICILILCTYFIEICIICKYMFTLYLQTDDNVDSPAGSRRSSEQVSIYIFH